jgi:UDP-glucuronate decarboxylase
MHPNDGRVVSNFIVQALRGKDITIFGDGSQTRSFCYVDDLIRGMIAMMNTPDCVIGPVNLGNPAETTILEAAKLIIELTGAKSKLVFQPLPQDDPVRRRPCIDRAREALGWEPRVPFRDGLQKTIAYFDDYLKRNPDAGT